MRLSLFNITFIALVLTIAGAKLVPAAENLSQTLLDSNSKIFFENPAVSLRRGGGSRSSSRGRGRGRGKGRGGGDWRVGSFIGGCILIPFGLTCLWKNEKKMVTYAKLIEQAEKECVNVEAEETNFVNDFKLIHVSGQTHIPNDEKVLDPDFGIEREQVYRIRRKVEMFQWKEDVTYLGKVNGEDKYR